METLLITKLTIINPIYSLFRLNYSVKHYLQFLSIKKKKEDT